MEFYVSKRKPIIIWPILNIKASFPEGTWRNILVSIWLHPKHGSWKIISTRIHFFFLSMVSRCIVVLKNDRIHYESLYGTVEYLIKHHYVSWCQNGTSLTSLLFNHWPKKIKVKGSLPHPTSIWASEGQDLMISPIESEINVGNKNTHAKLLLVTSTTCMNTPSEHW